MSIQCFKKKGVILYGGGMHTTCPGKRQQGPGAIWITPLPFCNSSTESKQYFSTTGFSINGGHRNISYVGQNRKQYGTPFRGIYPTGNGGTNGSFTKNILLNMNSAKAEIQGNQYKYIKPSTQMTKTKLSKKYHYIYHGQYPFKWVQPTYPTGPLDQNANMSSYIQKLKTENMQPNKPLRQDQQDELCQKCENSSGGGKYTKTTHQPIDESDYLQHIQRRCLNPSGASKPFPFNALNSTSVAPPATIITEYYMVPPKWYLADKC